MTDIETTADLIFLMETFYSKALADEQIGHFFTKVAPLNMQTHITLIVSFWESVLFDKAGYKGNVMEVHQHLHQLSPFIPAHFDRWVQIFKETVNALFAGVNTEKILQRAESIATVMKIKLAY